MSWIVLCCQEVLLLLHSPEAAGPRRARLPAAAIAAEVSGQQVTGVRWDNAGELFLGLLQAVKLKKF